jgi:hypothetical protein
MPSSARSIASWQFHRRQSWRERAVAKVFQIEMSARFWTVGLHRHALHMAM